jgi:mannosylfructose-phosphate synthase
MTRETPNILMLSTHGYVAAEPELGKPDTGGQVVFVMEMARRFHELGCEVDIVTRRFEDQPAEDRIDEGLRVWRIPFGGSQFIRKEDMHEHLDEFVRTFLHSAREEGRSYDVINSHYWDAGWAGMHLARELHVPHVHTPHSLGWWKQQEMRRTHDDLGLPYRFEERIAKEREVYRQAAHIIATSPQQVGLLQEQYGLGRDDISLIPPGIDERRFTPAPPRHLQAVRQRLGLGPMDVYSVGRAASNKGYDLLIRAFATLRQLEGRARLVLAPGANDGSDCERIEAWKALAGELGVGDGIVWKDYIPDDQMADYYRAAGVFALPSRYEPFGMTAAEAMACGTPTVLTVHGGLHKMVEFGQHALYADPQQPLEFAAMLGMPLRYPRLRQRLAMHGSRLALEEFGWTGLARRTLDLFRQVCEAQQPGPAVAGS